MLTTGGKEVHLVLVLLLHVHGREQVLGGVGVDRPLHQLDVARHCRGDLRSMEDIDGIEQVLRNDNK